MKEALHYITLLFEKRDREGLTPDEDKMLQEWVAAAPEERAIEFKKTQDPFDWLPELKEAVSVTERAEQLEKEGRKRALRLIKEHTASEKTDGPIRKMRYWYWAAASIAVLITFTTILLYQPQKKAGIIGTVRPVDSSNLLHRAILSISDLETIVLDDKDGTLLNQGGTKIVKKGDGVRYQPESDSMLAYLHRLITPKGCQYMITLPDQTAVWLNAGSSLEFPSAFTGVDRSVTLTGEAYFEVAKNSAKPFIVKYDDMRVEVKGTKFNINGYNRDKLITTLTAGSVKVTRGREYKMLTPGEQSIVSKEAQMVVQVADLENVLAWRSGRLYFNNENLESIMETLSRWYDIEVVFEDPVMELYSGSFKREMPIEKVLSMLQANGGFRFWIEEGNIVHIRRQ